MAKLNSWSERRNGSRLEQRGVVSLEIVTCLVPLLVVFLCAVQLALLGVGRLVVTHAATRGVRAAIVLLEDDPENMGGAPRGNLDAAPGVGGPGKLGVALGKVLPGAISAPRPRGGARLQAIREAVYAPLAAISPAPAGLLSGGSTTLHDAVGGGAGALGRFAAGLLAYVRGATVVTLRAGPGSAEVVSRVAPRADVTVHVTYLQQCSVPIAARLMCDGIATLAGDGRMGASPAARKLTAAENPALLLPSMLRGARFAVVEAEATLPNQGASYYSNGDQPHGQP